MIPDCVPYLDFERREREEERWLSRRPRCCECGEHIQEKKHYVIDGRHYCCECCKEVDTDDYIDCEE